MSHRVLIVDDHAMVAMALQVSFRARGWRVEVAPSTTRTEVLAVVEHFQPNCVLLDLNLDGCRDAGLHLIEPICELGPTVVMLTGETDQHLLAACLKAGAVGWIGKQAKLDEVICGISDALEGRPLVGSTQKEQMLNELRIRQAQGAKAQTKFDRLTQSERNVLCALIEGKNAEEISCTQFVAVATVRSHIRSILQKLNVHSQLAAVSMATNAGWEP